MSTSQLCPKCGSEIDQRVASGLCPVCLLKDAIHPTDEATEARASRWVPPPLDLLSAAFPNLDILELVGTGGMGAVYKVRQQSLDRIVALKILAPHYANDPDFAVRFTREAKLLGALSHPNIVAVHDFGNANGFYFFLMEYVDGVNLRQAMSVAKMSPEQALHIIPPICDALQYAHDRGIVHRDIKPENLLLDRSGQIKIVDFGIARIVREESRLSDAYSKEEAGIDEPGKERDSNSCGPSKIVGTPRYMAPEQFSAPHSVDHRADIYALGVVFYEMLTGETPTKSIELPSSKVEIDIRLDSIVLKALQTEPALRYSTASELRQSIVTISLDRFGSVDRPGSQAVLPSPTLYERGIITEYHNLQSSMKKLFLWKQQGSLELNDRSLTIHMYNRVETIPLANINHCSLGLFPTIVNPCGIYYIRLDTPGTNSSEVRPLCVAPYGIRVGLPASFNDNVLHWYGELLKRISAAQKKTIPSQFDQQLPQRKWEMAIFGMTVAIPIMLVPLATLQLVTPLSYSVAAFPLAIVIGIATVVGVSQWNWTRIRKKLIAAESIEAMVAVNQRQRIQQLRGIPLFFIAIFAIFFLVMAFVFINLRNSRPSLPTAAPQSRVS